MAWIQTYLDNECTIGSDEIPVSLIEIGVVFGRMCRFGGHTKDPYTVAEHSVYVSRLVPDELRVAALLHDAHEVYTGLGDVCKPTKELINSLSDNLIRRLEHAADRAIADHFEFPVGDFYAEEIKYADLIAMAHESRDLMGPHPKPWIELPEPPSWKLGATMGMGEDATAQFLMECVRAGLKVVS